MGFFDLNIPYHEADKHLSNKTAAKTARLKIAVKAIELGYSGAAYNRTVAGVMSDHHRCSTPVFPISSVLHLSPFLSSTVSLHRRLFGAPEAAPFRQYTRVTVVVESSAQAAALNLGNPVLKSYDIVAVRPMSQQAFEQACTGSEVDLISIDFSEKLPFRLKQHMVKAAIERDIYFEIAYSALLMDVQLRRQMLTSCKLLVDWTRGKNLIISSGAQFVTQMRGPYDVANLCSLLGLSMEHAKSALSKNCRSLIAKALRKKHCFKEAIRVEIIPSGQGFDSNEHWLKDWIQWDPISSGEGDLFLNDMVKSFSDANKVAKVVKSIDFASITDKLPSHGLQVHKLKPVAEATVHSLETDSSSADSRPTKFTKSFLDPSEDLTPLSLEDMAKSFSATNKVDKTVKPVGFASITEKLPSHGLQLQDLKPVTEATIHAFETDLSFADTMPTKLEKIFIDPSECWSMSHTSSSQHQSSCEVSVKSTLSTQIQGYLVNNEITENHTAEGIERHNDSDLFPHGTITHCLQPQKCIRRCDAQVGHLDCSASVDSSLTDIDIIGARKSVSGADSSSTLTNDISPLFSVKTSSHSVVGFQEDGMKPVSTEMNLEVEEDTQLTWYELIDVDDGQLKEMTAVVDAMTSASPLDGVSYDEGHKIDHMATNEVSIVTDTEVKKDLSQTLCVSDAENSRLQEMKDACVALPVLLSQDEISGNSGHNTVISELSNEVVMEDQMVTEGHALSSSQATVLDRLPGKKKTKHRMPSQAFVFPFKRILNHAPFKRKSHKVITQGKLL